MRGWGSFGGESGFGSEVLGLRRVGMIEGREGRKVRRWEKEGG